MKRAISLAIGALFVLAACSSDSPSTSATTTTTTKPASSSSSAATGSASASSATSSSSAGATVLSVATNAKLGSVLVDSKGMTVYLYEPDGTGAASTVPDAIKANWPMVPATGSTAVGPGLDSSKVGGTTQLSYNGHLLYTFVGDKAAGDANGQDLGGVWYVLSPTGDKIDG